ncbi:MAG: glycerophosphodiester phosphodiesterase [Deltaproteobacteria bacterium]|nr:glycerophosphodiester phosphodiesterase [Deltaproteobacteria bacterium]
MNIPFWAENLFHTFVDTTFATIPRPFPGENRLKACKIISHRGENDNKHVVENTIQAFDKISQNGIWGIEFDVRWTKDLHPIVFHDKDLKRIFNSSIQIQKMTLSELKTDFSIIPTLEEIISRYSKSLHLMVEIKKETYPEPDRQNQIMKDLFSGLTPEIDYHFISLTPEMFQFFDFLPHSAYLPIAQINTNEFSKIAIQKKYGGIMGQYFLLNNSLVKKHLSMGQKIGTGFIGSKNCLFRELNRGVEWFFSNNAVEMQLICNSSL